MCGTSELKLGVSELSSKVDYQVNGSQGTEYFLPCTSCARPTAHKVIVSLEESGGSEWVQWLSRFQIVQCQGCRTASFRSESGTSEDHVQVGEDEWEYMPDERLYPPRIAGRRGLGDDEFLLPANVRSIYRETMTALAAPAPVIAGIGLRVLLEAVCKEKQATGNNLYEQIDALVASSVLTPASAAILHKIRTLGNTAAHEAKPHSDKQLWLAMDVLEHLLKDVYVLPTLAASEFKDD